MHLTYRKTCRICNSLALTKVIDLGEQHLQGSFIKEEKENPPLRKIATELVRCDPTIDEKACGLLQMATSVPPEILYLSYWYRSGTNQTMHNHLKALASVSVEMLGKESAIVLDIGCNDGTLLNYYPDKFAKYGVDPSDVAQQITGDITVIQDIFPSAELNSVLDEKRVDIITSIAMFYDLEDPVSFVKNIKSILSDNGIWIFEQSYMPSMLQMNSYDTICHEHLEYYSFSVIENLLDRADMKVFKVEFNDITNMNLTQQIDKTYKDSLESLAESTGDLSLEGIATP